MKLQKLLPLFIPLLVIFSAADAKAQAKPGCEEKCGNMTIPYPFGMQEGCYLDESYIVYCGPEYNALRYTNGIRVLSISLDGQLRVLAPMAILCYNKSGDLDSYTTTEVQLSRFPLSMTRNKFTVVGCDTEATLLHNSPETRCSSKCERFRDVRNGSCLGMGCCQTPIPKGITKYNLLPTSKKGHVDVWNFSKCDFAFIVEEDQYNFSSIDLENMTNISNFPAVLDWTVGDTDCQEAQRNRTTYICQQNSICYDVDNGPGYRCKCSNGFSGNPYLLNGCQDIDECKDPRLNTCTDVCDNTPGSYNCSCPSGYRGDGKIGGDECIQSQSQPHSLSLAVRVFGGISMGIAIALVMVICIYWGVKQRRVMKSRERLFKKNGGIMLQKLLFESVDPGKMARIFTEEELKKASNNFNEGNMIGQGGYGTVYRGTLADNTMVAIKKSRVIDRHQIEQFINEVIILSQINHPNVVQLLGCCLETQVPLLVYEYVTNKTLDHHLHEQHASSLTFEMRLKIAIETAEALSYMHSTTQIIHRDVKPTNILLSDDFKAKVSDFGISRFIPLDKTHLSTLVRGTIGYMDPEYYRSRKLTEKSDVYSFGVVLVELLIGERVNSLDIPAAIDEGLGAYLKSLLKEDSLVHVLDDQVKEEMYTEQVKGVAELAICCLELDKERRPSMKEVKEKLEATRNFVTSSLT